MKRFFSIDNILFRGISKWMDYVYVSILWCLCSIPVITAGAAASALYHTCNRCLLYERGYIFDEFKKSFKQNFKQATAITVILSVILMVIQLDMKLAEAKGNMELFQTLLVAVRLLILMTGVYIFPYISKYSVSFKQTVKNCLYIGILNFPWTILLCLIFMAALILVSIVPCSVLIIPACMGVFFNLVLERVFGKYDKGRDDV